MYKAIIDEEHGMFVQISTSLEDRHPRRDNAPEI